MNNLYTHQLETENKQLRNALKEEQQIIQELEEWLKKHIEEWKNTESEYLKGIVDEDINILDFIQKIKGEI